jgi:hypothetical protein
VKYVYKAFQLFVLFYLRASTTQRLGLKDICLSELHVAAERLVLRNNQDCGRRCSLCATRRSGRDPRTIGLSGVRKVVGRLHIPHLQASRSHP